MTPNQIPIDELEYLEHLVWVNKVIGDCLGFRIDRVASFDAALYLLGHPERWPKDAGEKARDEVTRTRGTPDEAAALAWLPMFAFIEKPIGRCPFWDKVAVDLRHSKTYKKMTFYNTKRYLVPYPKVSTRDELWELAADRFYYVLWNAYRVVIGKASRTLDTHRRNQQIHMKREQLEKEGKKLARQRGEYSRQWSWLRAVLHGNRKEIYWREVGHEEKGLPKHDPSKQKEKTDPKPARPRMITGHGDSLSSLMGKQGNQPLEEAELAELLRLFQSHAANLPKNEGLVLRLRIERDMSDEEIASALGWGIATVRRLLRQAINRLLGRLGDDPQGFAVQVP